MIIQSKTKRTAEAAEALWEAALSHFPYSDIQSTGYVQGDLEPDERGEIDYSEEFTFTAGKLFDETLEAGGWIDVRREPDEAEVSITGLFTVARNGDWQEGVILPECVGVHAAYDPEANEWELWIDAY
jgi:hypothetical protein